MNHSIVMEVDQPFSSADQLEYLQLSPNKESGIENEGPTSSILSASGFALMNSLMFPFGIHSDTITNSFSAITTPINGRTFGCRRDFHITASLQNFNTQRCQYGAWRDRAVLVTYIDDLLQHVIRVYPDHFHSDVATGTSALPNICISAPIERNTHSTAVDHNLKNARNDGMVTACPIQQSKISLLGK